VLQVIFEGAGGLGGSEKEGLAAETRPQTVSAADSSSQRRGSFLMKQCSQHPLIIDYPLPQDYAEESLNFHHTSARHLRETSLDSKVSSFCQQSRVISKHNRDILFIVNFWNMFSTSPKLLKTQPSSLVIHNIADKTAQLHELYRRSE